jgi:diacylglycerol kinase (ATP)
VRATLDLLRDGRTRTIDIGRVEALHVETDAPFTRHFVNVASFGLGGLVDRHVHAFSALGGRAAYGLATALALWGWKNPLIRMAIEGDHPLEVEMRAVTVAVANGRFFGGGMCIAPDAKLDDGLFDVTILGDLRRRDLIRAASGLYGTDGLSHPGILSRQGYRVRAESDDRVLLDIDGEPVGCLPATFEIEHGALEVVSA